MGEGVQKQEGDESGDDREEEVGGVDEWEDETVRVERGGWKGDVKEVVKKVMTIIDAKGFQTYCEEYGGNLSYDTFGFEPRKMIQPGVCGRHNAKLYCAKLSAGWKRIEAHLREFGYERAKKGGKTQWPTKQPPASIAHIAALIVALEEDGWRHTNEKTRRWC